LVERDFLSTFKDYDPDCEIGWRKLYMSKMKGDNELLSKAASTAKDSYRGLQEERAKKRIILDDSLRCPRKKKKVIGEFVQQSL
jgi:hypothetical protein